MSRRGHLWSHHQQDWVVVLQVLALVSGSAGFIRSVHGWKTVCALIAVTSLHPEAAGVSMKALASVARPSALSPVAFTPVLEAVVSCVERNAKVIIWRPPLCPWKAALGSVCAGTLQTWYPN